MSLKTAADCLYHFPAETMNFFLAFKDVFFLFCYPTALEGLAEFT